MSVAIIGLGNLLQADDGVGVYAARALAAHPPPHAAVYEAASPTFDAFSVFEQAKKIIVVGAVDAGEKPGAIVKMELDPAESTAPRAGLQDLDLPALLRSLPPGRRPRVVIVGIQPSVVGVGAALSPPVAASLDELVKVVRDVALNEAGTPRRAVARRP